MITIFFINVFAALVTALFSSLPEATMPQPIIDAFASVSAVTTVINQFLPLDTFLYIVSLAVIVETSIVTFRFGNWVKKLFRGSG